MEKFLENRAMSRSRSWPTSTKRRFISARRTRLLDAAPPPENHRGRPAPGIPGDRQDRRALRRNGKKIGYRGAGTFEFPVRRRRFYFIEMNTRVQVQHPVTELITGVDIVQEQIKIAANQKMTFGKGHHQEGPRDRMPHQRRRPEQLHYAIAGTHHQLARAGRPGIRVDSHAYNGYFVTANYDSMVGKLLAYGATRSRPSPACASRCPR